MLRHVLRTHVFVLKHMPLILHVDLSTCVSVDVLEPHQVFPA